MAFQSKPNQSVGVYVGEPGHSGNMVQAPLSPTLNQTSAIRIAAIFGAPTLTACEPQRMQLRCRLGVRLHPPPHRSQSRAPYLFTYSRHTQSSKSDGSTENERDACVNIGASTSSVSITLAMHYTYLFSLASRPLNCVIQRVL